MLKKIQILVVLAVMGFTLSCNKFGSRELSKEKIAVKFAREVIRGGYGIVTVNETILDGSINLTISANNSCLFRSEILANYSRETKFDSNFTCGVDEISWTVRPILRDPGIDYRNYYVKMSKIQSDYTNFLVTLNGSGISYEYLNGHTLRFFSPVDQINFLGANP